jgi:hypothetical protein
MDQHKMVNNTLTTGVCWTDELQTRRKATSDKDRWETKDVEREDLWRFIMTSDLISLSIHN